MFKSTVKRLLGEKALGAIDFFNKPSLKEIWGGAFNGQHFRREIFKEIMSVLQPVKIVETGTFRGNTTAFMATNGVPIRSVEFSDRLFGYVKTRFLLNPKIRVEHNDSRVFLASLARDIEDKSETTFFYLDAHWNDDLPLAEELTIVFSNWPQAVVMVDDFQVPGSSYSYDDYGEGKALTLDYVNAVDGVNSLTAFFPSLSAEQETGAKRGCVVFALEESVIDQLRLCATLCEYEP